MSEHFGEKKTHFKWLGIMPVASFVVGYAIDRSNTELYVYGGVVVGGMMDALKDRKKRYGDHHDLIDDQVEYSVQSIKLDSEAESLLATVDVDPGLEQIAKSFIEGKDIQSERIRGESN